jgi:hypothetical protein
MIDTKELNEVIEYTTKAEQQIEHHQQIIEAKQKELDEHKSTNKIRTISDILSIVSNVGSTVTIITVVLSVLFMSVNTSVFICIIGLFICIPGILSLHLCRKHNLPYGGFVAHQYHKRIKEFRDDIKNSTKTIELLEANIIEFCAYRRKKLQEEYNARQDKGL